jgi:two-component system NtrC family sensor kinase
MSQETPQTKKIMREKGGDSVTAMFAAALAHELGNPLDAIRRYVNLALEQVAGDPVAGEYLLKAKRGISQALFVLNELSGYSRRCYDQPAKVVEIHSLLERSLNALSDDEQFKGIFVQRIFSEEAMHVEDRGLLIVLHNLYKNAAHAMKGQGTLTIATWRQNGSVGVAIQDTGQGVPETIKERIFEPFFTTKNCDEGTGIGLALSREIVERCGGELRCEDVPDTGSGARFVLILPRKTPQSVFKDCSIAINPSMFSSDRLQIDRP